MAQGYEFLIIVFMVSSWRYQESIWAMKNPMKIHDSWKLTVFVSFHDIFMAPSHYYSMGHETSWKCVENTMKIPWIFHWFFMAYSLSPEIVDIWAAVSGLHFEKYWYYITKIIHPPGQTDWQKWREAKRQTLEKLFSVRNTSQAVVRRFVRRHW